MLPCSHGRQPEEGDIILTPGVEDEHPKVYLWPPREDLSVRQAAASV